MKKNLLLLTLVAIMSALLLLTACGAETTTTENPDLTTTSQTEITTTTAVETQNPVLVTAYDEPDKYVSLPDFADITVSKAPIQEEVDNYLADVLSSMGRDDYVETESGTVAIIGDSLNIHYTGRAKDASVTLSAETLAGMSNASDEAGYDLILGSGSFIPGFEDQLVGAKAGETITVDVTFPDGYSEELSNLEVLFEVKVNSINRCTVSERNTVVLSVIYSIKDNTASDKLSSFLASHESTIDLTDSEALFDEIFPVADIKEYLIGKPLYGTASFDVVMPLESAEEYGYNSAITLTAMVTIEQVVYYPTEITDEDINTLTGGDYKTAADFEAYVFNHYKCTYAYKAVIEAASFSDIPTEVYDILYKTYYDTSIYNQVGDIEGLTEEELAEVLTETVVNTAKEFAESNATAEYQDRMLMAYLTKKLNFTLTDEKYQQLLEDLYNYYLDYYYIYLLYSGITDITSFEAYFGVENLRFQFTTDEIVNLIGEKVTLVD